MDTQTSTSKTYRGSCHCGAVRFEAELSLDNLSKCNCSVCTKINGAGTFAKPDGFRLLAGEDALGSYAWGAKISTRHFCKHSGVHCFGKGHLAELGAGIMGLTTARSGMPKSPDTSPCSSPRLFRLPASPPDPSVFIPTSEGGSM